MFHDLKHMMQDIGEAKQKIAADDKIAVLSKCNEIIGWLDSHRDASKDECAAKQKELQDVSGPIIANAA